MRLPGIYIHIPFCRTKCTYCAFNSGDFDEGLAAEYLGALKLEIASTGQRLSASGNELTIDTLYFGGGTPSILPGHQLASLIETCRENFRFAPDAEITVEINPGTLTGEKLEAYRAAGVNRASLGVQSFLDAELESIGRVHTADQARAAVGELRQSGFSNISIDLIAGLPYQSKENWSYNLSEAIKLRPEHLSAYLLEIHSGTTLYNQVKRGLVKPIDEELAVEMYFELIDRLQGAGYEHYEISNFALKRSDNCSYRSRHNTKYWTDAPYYGFGVSAHSYDGRWRYWNVAPWRRYIELIHRNGRAVAERIEVTEESRYQEAAFLRLRLMDGIQLSDFRSHYGVDLLERYGKEIEHLSEAGLVELGEDKLRLSRQGLVLSNEVFSVFV